MLSIKSIWETFKSYELTEIMRQKDDKRFAIMLTKLARGQLEEADVIYFQNLITQLHITFQPQVMHLWATNNEVDEMNIRVLNSMNQLVSYSKPLICLGTRYGICQETATIKDYGLTFKINFKRNR